MDKLTTLLETASDADKVELKIHHDAQESCLKAYKAKSTIARKKDLDGARAGLDETVARMWATYFPDEERFKDAKTALAYLTGKGYKVAKSKMYKDRGKTLAVQVDGSILKRDLDLYATTLKYLGDPTAGLDKAQRRKAELEAEKLDKQNQLLEMDLKQRRGELVPRREAHMAMAAHITVVESTMRNAFITRAPEWVDLVGGDPAGVRTLVFAVEGALEDVFRAMADMGEFQVTFEA